MYVQLLQYLAKQTTEPGDTAWLNIYQASISTYPNTVEGILAQYVNHHQSCNSTRVGVTTTETLIAAGA